MRKSVPNLEFDRNGRRVIWHPKSLVDATHGVVASDPTITDALLAQLDTEGLWKHPNEGLDRSPEIGLALPHEPPG